MGDVNAAANSVNLCSYSVPNGSYTLYVQAVGKPSFTNQISGPVEFTSNCTGGTSGGATLSFGSSPSSLMIFSGGSGSVTVTATPTSGAFNNAIALTCSGLPQGLTCSFSPVSITPGSSAVSSVLAISAATTTAEDHRERGHSVPAAWMFGFGMLGFTFIGKVQGKRVFAVLGACVLAAIIVGGTSCGGNTSAAVKPLKAGSYTVTVNGRSSSVQLSTT